MKKILLYGSLFLIGLSSCKKKTQNNDLSACKDNTLAEMIYLDVYKEAQTYLGVFLEKKSPDDTAVLFSSSIDKNNITFPFTLTIYYGDSDHLCSDGKYRRGALNLNVSAANGDTTIFSVNNVDITFSNYHLNQSNLLGTFTINNGALSGKGHQLFNVSVKEGFVINSNGTMSWNSTKVLEQTLGSATPNNINDDEYLLTGSGSGKDFKGSDFKENIATACTIKANCRYFITSGKISVEPINLDVRNCDYGAASGSCTGQVKVQIKEESANFSL